MNNPYYLDMTIDYTNKRKYSEIESSLKKSTKTNKKSKYYNNDRFYNASRKRMHDIQDTYGIFSKIKL
jgi:hypothetical protein